MFTCTVVCDAAVVVALMRVMLIACDLFNDQLHKTIDIIIIICSLIKAICDKIGVNALVQHGKSEGEK